MGGGGMVTKFLEFRHTHPIQKVVKLFFTILTSFPEIQPRPRGDYDFLGSKIKKIKFFQLFHKKILKFALDVELAQLKFSYITVLKQPKLSHIAKEFLKNFRSKKIINRHRSRLNFWKTCQDSKKMTLPPSSWDVYG